jgi:hypothetical protein
MHAQSNNWPTWAIDVVNDAGNALLVPAAGALAQYAWETIEGLDHVLSDEAVVLVEQELALGGGLRLVGYVWWAMMVKDGARWDFKDQINTELRASIMLGDNEGCDWYEYSMPGNIFYAYVGRVAGFSELEIRAGAVYAQQTDPENDPALNDWFGLDQASDQAALEVGFQMYTAVGRSPSESVLMAAFKTALTAKKSGLAHMPAPVVAYESPFPIGPNGSEFPLRYFDGVNCIGFLGE